MVANLTIGLNLFMQSIPKMLWPAIANQPIFVLLKRPVSMKLVSKNPFKNNNINI